MPRRNRVPGGFSFTYFPALGLGHSMSLRATLHRISHLKWVLLVIEIALLGYCFVASPDNLVAVIGVTIFVAGLQLGFDSLSDQEQMSDATRARYVTTNYAKRQAQLLLVAIAVLTLISVMFLSLHWFASKRNAELFAAFFDLGLDCLALVLGMLCALKSVRDKQECAAQTPTNRVSTVPGQKTTS